MPFSARADIGTLGCQVEPLVSGCRMETRFTYQISLLSVLKSIFFHNVTFPKVHGLYAYALCICVPKLLRKVVMSVYFLAHFLLTRKNAV